MNALLRQVPHKTRGHSEQNVLERLRAPRDEEQPGVLTNPAAARPKVRKNIFFMFFTAF